MKKIMVLFFCFSLFFTALACESETGVVNEPEVQEIKEVEEVEETFFSQEDFVLRIDTLPYRGAVLFIDYNGEIDISEYELRVEITHEEKITQRDIVEEIDDNLISEIVDFMYLPGDELKFTLKVTERDNQIFECYHSESLQRYPWKDWMLAEGEWFSFGNRDNFVYGRPSWGGVGGHASWDIETRVGAPVYSGTVGILLEEFAPGSVEIFNPYVGAYVQYGHVNLSKDLYVDKIVMPGEHIGNVQSKYGHIHYSTIRPYKLGWNRERNSYWFVFLIFQEGNLYDLKYYKDPFYFHEPTTLGYWNEETLPPGTKEEMINLFQKYNPDIILPATKPLDVD